MTTALVIALGSGVATAAGIDDPPTATAPSGERPSAAPPQVFGAPGAGFGAGAGFSAAVSANRPPNTPKGPEVGPPFKQTSGVWQTNTLTPTLRNTVVDPDGNKTTSTFEVWTVKADGSAGSKVSLTDDNQWGVLVSGFTASGTPTSVTVPNGKLKDGWTYLVRSSAYDGSAYETDWSPWSKFKVTAPVDRPVEPSGVASNGKPGEFTVTLPAGHKARWVEWQLDNGAWQRVDAAGKTSVTVDTGLRPGAPITTSHTLNVRTAHDTGTSATVPITFTGNGSDNNGGDSGNRGDDVPADVKAKWQQLANEALASYDREQAKIADIKAHGLGGGSDGGAAAALEQLHRNSIVLPDNGFYGVPREFMAARVYDDRTPNNNPTVSTVGGCEGALHCTQKFRLDYVLSVDTFYCTAPNVPSDIGSKCPEKDIRWTGFSSESQTEEFSRTYNRITDGWDKFIGQTLGDLPKIFMQCVSGDTSQPPVVASPPIARATADQCADTGMQLGSLVTLGRIGSSAKVVDNPLAEVNFTAEQIAKAKLALNDLKAGVATNQYAKALNSIIDSAVKADKTGGLAASFSKIVDLPTQLDGLPAKAKPLMNDYKPFGNLTIEEWFHKYWTKGEEWGMKYPTEAAGFPDGFQGAFKPHYPVKGEFMDRFGGEGFIDAKGAVRGGGFLAPRDGTPYSQRALPPDNVVAKVDERGGYHVYKWIKDWTTEDARVHGDIQGGKIAPWFEQPGGGIQYKLPSTVNVHWLLKNKYIVEIFD
ncbi:TNT domain-containing protein [Streptomyces sp. HUAS TT7]|uniref:TNT domain-containing protein n=1 Tax=Streptomyces sp. HUAS TT7 TaxID=3447507 RepID=UPI003F655F4F